MTTERRIKMNDILVGSFLLGLFTIVLTVVVHYAVITIFEEFYWGHPIEEVLLFMLSLIVSLEIIGLILIMYLLYRRLGPAEGVT